MGCRCAAHRGNRHNVPAFWLCLVGFQIGVPALRVGSAGVTGPGSGIGIGPGVGAGSGPGGNGFVGSGEPGSGSGWGGNGSGSRCGGKVMDCSFELIEDDIGDTQSSRASQGQHGPQAPGNEVENGKTAASASDATSQMRRVLRAMLMAGHHIGWMFSTCGAPSDLG